MSALRVASFLPAGKERFGPPETQNRPLSPLSLPLSHSPRAATRESEIGRRIEINAPMSKSALARSAIFLPDIAVDINVPNLCQHKEDFCPLSLLSLISIAAPKLFQSWLLGKPSQE